MRKCHLRKAQGKVRPLHNIPGQSQRTAYDKHNMAYPIHSQPLNPACQLLAGQHLPLNGQGNDVSPIFNIRKDTLSFLFLNLPLNGLAGPVRALFIRYLDDIQFTVAAQALGILLMASSKYRSLIFSNRYKGNLHLLKLQYHIVPHSPAVNGFGNAHIHISKGFIIPNQPVFTGKNKSPAPLAPGPFNHGLHQTGSHPTVPVFLNHIQAEYALVGALRLME